MSSQHIDLSNSESEREEEHKGLSHVFKLANLSRRNSIRHLLLLQLQMAYTNHFLAGKSFVEILSQKIF